MRREYDTLQNTVLPLFYAPLTQSFDDVQNRYSYQQSASTPTFDENEGSLFYGSSVRYYLPIDIINYNVAFKVKRIGDGPGTSKYEYMFALHYSLSQNSTSYERYKLALAFYRYSSGFKLWTTIQSPSTSNNVSYDNYVSSAKVFQNNQWYDVRIEIRIGSQKIYIDDTLIGSFSLNTSATYANGYHLCIGENQNYFIGREPRFVNAQIKDFKITEI